jgi:hypothetical protein
MAPASLDALVANAASEKLSLATATLRSEHFYASLPLCVIDAVYSIGARLPAPSWPFSNGRRHRRPNGLSIAGKPGVSFAYLVLFGDRCVLERRTCQNNFQEPPTNVDHERNADQVRMSALGNNSEENASRTASGPVQHRRSTPKRGAHIGGWSCSFRGPRRPLTRRGGL